MNKMVQYSVWPNCCNACDFCLRQERGTYSKEKMLYWLDMIKKNINYIDWENEYNYGISLLGGELYHITDKEIQESFLELIDIIIEKILKVSQNPNCRYSTVTNGLYNPEFLYKVIDKIKDSVGIEKVDINFSYDLKYRFHSKDREELCLKNINEFHQKYNYCIGVQMILTQYLIDMWKNNEFDVNQFINDKIPGNILTFLYPHPIMTGKKINDFQFKRSDFLQFIQYLKKDCPNIYFNFLQSTKNSCIFKWTGLQDRKNTDYSVQPILSDGKEIINNCSHSILYKCYSDSNKCVLCDLKTLDKEAYI